MPLIRSFAGACLVVATAAGALACAGDSTATDAAACLLTTGTPTLSVSLGQTTQVRATPSCARLGAALVRWTSSAPEIVAVDSLTGFATALQAGSATLHAKIPGERSAAVDVQVSVSCPGLPAMGPTITPATLTLATGGVGRVRASVPRSLGAPTCAVVTDTAFTFASLDTTIATVDASGTVRGVRAGQTVVRATLAANTSLVASVPVTVVRVGFFDPPDVSPTTVTLGVGGTQRLAVHVPVLPGAPAGTDTTARFRSSDSCVATVSADGLVFGRWPGTATVAVFAAADTNMRTAVGVIVVPTPIGPRINIRSVASGTPPVETTDRTVHGLVTVTFTIFYDIAPNGGRLDVTLGGRLAVSQPIPPIATSPAPYVVSVTFDSDARDAAGVRLFPNGTLQLIAGVVPTPPAPGGCMPTGAGQQVAMPLTIANP